MKTFRALIAAGVAAAAFSLFPACGSHPLPASEDEPDGGQPYSLADAHVVHLAYVDAGTKD